MGDQKNQPQEKEIGFADIVEFLESKSDFSFEMKVLQQLHALGFDCSHSGTYRDPITDKSREYDIRAEKREGNRCLYVSVECKGLSKAGPLLVHTTARSEHESSTRS